MGGSGAVACSGHHGRLPVFDKCHFQRAGMEFERNIH
jgi:hypothetical protein